jgi:hypothetical protein
METTVYMENMDALELGTLPGIGRCFVGHRALGR